MIFSHVKSLRETNLPTRIFQGFSWFLPVYIVKIYKIYKKLYTNGNKFRNIDD